MPIENPDNSLPDPGSRAREFNSRINYELMLSYFRDEFNRKWNLLKPSQSVGLKDYLILAQIGVGSYGKVLLVNQINSPFNYACKVLHKEFIVRRRQESHILNERQILECVNFPNLVKLVFSTKDNNYLYLGLPYLIGGELFKFHRIVEKFEESQACFYAAQVFLALEYLHNVKVAYRDLKPENICFERNGYITLTDFGFAKRINNHTYTLCGTPEFLAPEIIQAIPYGQSVDWWAFGILLFEFVHGSSPFSMYQNKLQMYEKIIDVDYQMPKTFSTDLKLLINGFLEADITKRLGSINEKEIRLQKWFSSVDWYGILNQSIKPPYLPHILSPKDTTHFDGCITVVKPLPHSRNNLYEEVFAEF